MTQQKSENRVVPEGRRKSVQTRGPKGIGGGKAVPVNEAPRQLGMRFEAAEDSARAETDGVMERPGGRSVARAERKTNSSEEGVLVANLESVVRRLRLAFEKVASNRGASGPDGQSIQTVREHLAEVMPALEEALLKGTYAPGNIRRVWIPKASGGQRGLGIPNVIDRVVQEATRQVLEPEFEPRFHPSSHGFRPGRSCQTAIQEAKAHLEEGYGWVVDLDLENFFNRVHHQRLMARLAKRVTDKGLLVLIGKMLKAQVVMPDGVVVSNDEGVPQGGPLSPLLSNIVLDELDWELEQRGHRFVRYADDANIYVQSERAGQRVMESVTRFIERRLRLKVNVAKSAVARPEERHFLGFSLRRKPEDGDVEIGLSKRSKERIDTKVRELTPRNWGGAMKSCISGVNRYLTGWMGFFGICTAQIERTLQGLDAHIRRRLRALQLKQWKRKVTIARRLIEHGVSKKSAWRSVYKGRRSFWAMSHMPTVERALPNCHWNERGLRTLLERYRAHSAHRIAPVQLELQLG
jgi:RNA-directed DNA polymerase